MDEQPLREDTLFRRKGKRSAYPEVDAPVFALPIADTHAHLQLMSDPVLALARAGMHMVHFICTIVDVTEDGTKTFDELDSWRGAARSRILALGGQAC